MEAGPLISVIIPVYNGEAFLAEAVESIRRQSYEPLEIIIVDDGSTDGTRSVVEGFGREVRYIHQANSGIGAARNRGVELARGSLFAFLDADDLWTEDKLSLQMAALGNDPGLDMVFGHVEQFVSPDMDEGAKSTVHLPEEMMPGYCATTLMVRRESFLEVGPFETDLKVGEFISWFIRAKEKGLKSVMLPEVVCRRRIHEDNTGIRERESRSDYLKILKLSLDRRRKSRT